MRSTVLYEGPRCTVVLYDNGEVFNIDKWGNKKPRYTIINRDGYRMVKLRIGGALKGRLIHRLVALTWIPNPENKRTVNHKDGDKLNNDVSNLEWATDKENVEHARNVLGVGTMPEEVYKYKLDGTLVAKYRTRTIAIAENKGVCVQSSYSGNWIKGEHIFILKRDVEQKGLEYCMAIREKKVSKKYNKRKLTAEDVSCVEYLLKTGRGTQEDISKLFSVSRKTINKISVGRYLLK